MPSAPVDPLVPPDPPDPPDARDLTGPPGPLVAFSSLVPLSGSLLDNAVESAATRVYLAVLRMERPTRELLLAQGIPAAVVDPALGVLHARGLVHLGPHGSLDVPPPLSSIPQHALDLERRATQVRAAAHELTQVYYSARSRDRDPDTGVQLLLDLDDVGAQTNLIIANAQHELLSARRLTLRTHEILAAPLESHREPSVGLDGRRIEHRTVWDTGVLELPGALDVLAARSEGGEVQRFLTRVPMTFVVVDHTACLIEWSSIDAPGPQGILVQTRGLVLAAIAVFERLWELSTPLVRGAASPDELDHRDARILRLMAAGVADASIARQAGVSQRTVERRIRSLMDRLSAETRFQAGVQAVHRGWL
ncbi:helix-turn-helix transcriptional regulator [Lapillicoccus sp.]|uniref:helix-turn-helix transcriptional regulator n=1 Tax=Lapillicoccus sp. TaxID=1909287 RepID=UPI0025EAC026|nr:helix-turn-helix transcriptional regulator [Lapillicoccus sp.]